MATGVIIAKEGFSIEGSPDELYVDPSTDLQRVIRSVSGSFSTDGTTFQSVGDYQWVKDGNSYFLTIPIPEVDYIPQYVAFMDQVSLGKRMKISNILGGVSVDGDLGAFVTAGKSSNGVPFVRISFRFNRDNITIPEMLAGIYGYFVELYYDRIERKKDATGN